MYRAALVCAVMLAVSSPLSGDCSASDKKALEEFDRAWGAVRDSGADVDVPEEMRDRWTGVVRGA